MVDREIYVKEIKFLKNNIFYIISKYKLIYIYLYLKSAYNYIISLNIALHIILN